MCSKDIGGLDADLILDCCMEFLFQDAQKVNYYLKPIADYCSGHLDGQGILSKLCTFRLKILSKPILERCFFYLFLFPEVILDPSWSLFQYGKCILMCVYHLWFKMQHLNVSSVREYLVYERTGGSWPYEENPSYGTSKLYDSRAKLYKIDCRCCLYVLYFPKTCVDGNWLLLQTVRLEIMWR